MDAQSASRGSGLRYDESYAAMNVPNANCKAHCRTISVLLLQLRLQRAGAYSRATRERKVCKYWLSPLALARNDGFSARELNQIRVQIALNLEMILEAWHEHWWLAQKLAFKMLDHRRHDCGPVSGRTDDHRSVGMVLATFRGNSGTAQAAFEIIGSGTGIQGQRLTKT